MRPQFSYILNYFRKLYKVPVEIEIGHDTKDKKVNITVGDWNFFQSFQNYPVEKVIWKKWKEITGSSEL